MTSLFPTGWGEKTGAGGGGGGGKQREKASGSRGDRGERDRGARGGGARGGGGGGRGQPFGDEAKLLRQLLRGYEKNTRPVANASHTIVVEINFALTQILDMVSEGRAHSISLAQGVFDITPWGEFDSMRWSLFDFTHLRTVGFHAPQNAYVASLFVQPKVRFWAGEDATHMILPAQ